MVDIDEQKRRKLVLVGDGMVGKTSMLMTYVNKTFPEDSIPTMFDVHDCTINYNHDEVLMEVADCGG